MSVAIFIDMEGRHGNFVLFFTAVIFYTIKKTVTRSAKKAGHCTNIAHINTLVSIQKYWGFGLPFSDLPSFPNWCHYYFLVAFFLTAIFPLSFLCCNFEFSHSYSPLLFPHCHFRTAIFALLFSYSICKFHINCESKARLFWESGITNSNVLIFFVYIICFDCCFYDIPHVEKYILICVLTSVFIYTQAIYNN